MLYFRQISEIDSWHPFHFIWNFVVETKFVVAITFCMFKAIGLLIVLWGLSHFFSTAFVAFDEAARESFKLIEASAIVSQQKVAEQL